MLEGAEAGIEEQTFAGAAAAAAGPGPDVLGHDPAALIAPLLADSSLERALSERWAQCLTKMLSSSDTCTLLKRRDQASRSPNCPAGLLFAPPRPATDGDEEGDPLDWPRPITLALRAPGESVSEVEAALLEAAVANLCNRPAAAASGLATFADADSHDNGLVRSRVEREREAAAILAGDAAMPLRFGYHRILAGARNATPLNLIEVREAIESMAVSSTWRWAALRLVVSRLQSEAPDVLARLLDAKDTRDASTA